MTQQRQCEKREQKILKNLSLDWIRAAQIASAAMIALALAHQPALADPVTLTCNDEMNASRAPYTIVLDEAGHSVTMNDGKNLGRLAAVFDSGKITFTEVIPPPDGDPQNIWNYTLDRLTGNLSMITASGAPFPRMATCRPGKAQF